MPDRPERPTLEITASFRGITIATGHLREPGARYVVGATAGTNAPAPTDVVGERFTLAEATGSGFFVNVNAAMTGSIRRPGAVELPLAAWVSEHGNRFALPEGCTAEIGCGEARFELRATDAPVRLGRPSLRWRWRDQQVAALSGLALLFTLLFAAVLPEGGPSRVYSRFMVKLRLGAAAEPGNR